MARFRGVAIGQMLYAGDDVSGERWNHRRWNRQTEARKRLYELTLRAARTLPPALG